MTIRVLPPAFRKAHPARSALLRPQPPHIILRQPSAPILPPNLEVRVDGKALFPYQIDGILWLRSMYRALLADEMGLGKTAQLLRALIAPAIVVCPASLRLNWQAEAALYRPELIARIMSGGELPKPATNEILITSYESLPDPVPKVTKWLVPHHLRSDTTLLLDEVHFAKTRRAQRSIKTRLLSNQCLRVWGSTGTPLSNTPKDLWGVLSVIGVQHAAFGGYQGFMDAFGGERNRWGGVEFADTPPTDVPAMLKKVMLRRLRKDVMPQLPGKVYSTHYVKAPDFLLPELDLADAAWRQSGSEKLPPFTLLSAVRKQMAISRIPDAIEIVERYEEERIPLVAFCSHVEPLHAIGQRPGWGVITGDTKLELRHALVDMFQSGLLSGLAVSVKAGGVGLTMTRASHALFIDRSYDPSENSQAEDRLVRIGQDASSVMITYMMADHAVDRRLNEILTSKQRLIAASLGDNT